MSANSVAVVITTDNHIHAGKPAIKGKRLTVDETTAIWLVANKLARPADAPAPAVQPKKESK